MCPIIVARQRDVFMFLPHNIFVLYAVRVKKDSRRLVLPRTSCLISLYIRFVLYRTACVMVKRVCHRLFIVETRFQSQGIHFTTSYLDEQRRSQATTKTQTTIRAGRPSYLLEVQFDAEYGSGTFLWNRNETLQDFSWIRDSSVDIATGYGLDEWGIGIPAPVGSRLFGGGGKTAEALIWPLTSNASN
jgi:hypothetical protein